MRAVAIQANFLIRNTEFLNAKSLGRSKSDSGGELVFCASPVRAIPKTHRGGEVSIKSLRAWFSTRKRQGESIGRLGRKPATFGRRSILGVCLESERTSYDRVGKRAVKRRQAFLRSQKRGDCGDQRSGVSRMLSARRAASLPASIPFADRAAARSSDHPV